MISLKIGLNFTCFSILNHFLKQFQFISVKNKTTTKNLLLSFSLPKISLKSNSSVCLPQLKKETERRNQSEVGRKTV